MISLTSPGYEQSSARSRRCPTSRATLRPQGELLERLHAARRGRRSAQRHRRDQRPAAERGDQRRLPDLRRVPADRQGERERRPQRRRLRLPGRNADHRRPAHARPASAGAPTSRGWSTQTGKPANCVYPGPGEAEHPPSRAATRRARTRSSTSTRCSTSATAATNDVPLDQLSKDLRKAEKTPSYSFIAPTPATPGADRPVRGGRDRRGGRRRRLPLDLGAEDPRLARLQGRRPADRHLLRGQPAGAAGRLRPGRRPAATGALLVSPFAHSGRHRRRRRTTPTRCCAPARTLRPRTPRLAAAAKTKSFAPSLLAETAATSARIGRCAALGWSHARAAESGSTGAPGSSASWSRSSSSSPAELAAGAGRRPLRHGRRAADRHPAGAVAIGALIGYVTPLVRRHRREESKRS